MEWISVKERLPEKETPVLIAYKSITGDIKCDQTAFCMTEHGTGMMVSILNHQKILIAMSPAGCHYLNRLKINPCISDTPMI